MGLGWIPKDTFMPSFLNVNQLVQKLKGGTQKHIHRQHSDLISLYFSLLKETRMSINMETYFLKWLAKGITE
jgi:hypothetical protein